MTAAHGPPGAGECWTESQCIGGGLGRSRRVTTRWKITGLRTSSIRRVPPPPSTSSM